MECKRARCANLLTDKHRQFAPQLRAARGEWGVRPQLSALDPASPCTALDAGWGPKKYRASQASLLLVLSPPTRLPWESWLLPSLHSIHDVNVHRACFCCAGRPTHYLAHPTVNPEVILPLIPPDRGQPRPGSRTHSQWKSKAPRWPGGHIMPDDISNTSFSKEPL